ncbi:MAG: RNA methyltransferase [Candidatus Thermoplasmatota archaeon]
MKPPVVILVGTSHQGNAGAAARGAANFGVTDLRFVAPRCDVKGKEAIDRSVHAKPLLESAKVYPNLVAALEGCSLSVGTTARSAQAPNHMLRKPMDVRDFLDSLVESKWDGQLAYVFGPEDSGLHGDDVDRLDQLVTVPTADYNSLNLAHAVTLLCYEHFRLAAAGITPERELNPDALNALNRAWDELCIEVEPRAWRRRTAQGVWRKVVGRSLPATFEVHNLFGIVTNALKRFGHPEYATETSEKVLAERGLKVKSDHEGSGPGTDAQLGESTD